jgi:predicted nucleic acid-binding protein
MPINSYPATVLLDTNILLRAYPPASPHHAETVAALTRLEASGSRIHICPQTLQEFRQVATRDVAKNGLGLTSATTATLLTAFEQRYTMTYEIPDVYRRWRSIVESTGAIGRANFDARIVALAAATGLDAVLTFESSAFQRYASLVNIVILDPLQIAAS